MNLRRAVTPFRRGLLTYRGSGRESTISSFCAFQLYEFSNTIKNVEKMTRDHLRRFGRCPRDYCTWNIKPDPYVEFATAKVCPAIVHVSREKEIGGSGIIVDSKGTVLTSAHNIYPLDAGSEIIVSLRHRRKFSVIILEVNIDQGLALLKIQSETALPSTTIGLLENSDGNDLISIEHPLKRRAYPRPSSQNEVDEVDEEGNLMLRNNQFLSKHEYENFYMNKPGGPIVNLNGEVVGISTQIHVLRQVDEKNSFGTIDGMAIEEAFDKVGYV